MNYSEAARIRKQGISALMLQNYARGESSPVRKAISDRLKATGTNIASKFDPLNLVKMMTGSDLLTTFAGLLFKRDPRSIGYFTGRRTYPENVSNPHNMQEDAGAMPVASFGGKKTIRILKEMFAFMKKARAEDVDFNSYKLQVMYSHENLKQLRNDQLISIFLRAASSNAKDSFRNKNNSSSSGSFLKLIAFFGLAALVTKIKSIQEIFEQNITADFETVKQNFEELKIDKVVSEIEEFVDDLRKHYDDFEKFWNKEDTETPTAKEDTETPTPSVPGKPYPSITQQPKIVPSGESGLLKYISKLESGGSPTKLVGGKEKKDLTSMTVGEVLNFQSTMKTKGYESTAVGKYQIIRGTLKNLVDRDVVGEDEIFNETTQDKLAKALLVKAGLNDFKSGKISQNTFLDNISTVWAAVPFHTGKSFYSGLGSNKALSTRQEGLEAVQSVMTGNKLNEISNINAASKDEMETTGTTVVFNNTKTAVVNKQMFAPAVVTEHNPILKAAAQ